MGKRVYTQKSLRKFGIFGIRESYRIFTLGCILELLGSRGTSPVAVDALDLATWGQPKHRGNTTTQCPMLRSPQHIQHCNSSWLVLGKGKPRSHFATQTPHEEGTEYV